MTTKLRRSTWGLDTPADEGVEWRQRGECRDREKYNPDWFVGGNADEYGARTKSVGVYGGVLLRGPSKRRHIIRDLTARDSFVEDPGSTHFDTCYLEHAACLAHQVRRILGGING